MGILIVYLGVFFSVGLIHTLVWNRITREVNQNLPEAEQYSTSVWALRRSGHDEFAQFKIWDLHRKFFRDSYLRAIFVLTLVLVIFWMFFGLHLLSLLPTL